MFYSVIKDTIIYEDVLVGTLTLDDCLNAITYLVNQLESQDNNKCYIDSIRFYLDLIQDNL